MSDAQLDIGLAARLATTATGYGAVIDGVLNIRTVTETANLAAFNALIVCGYGVRTSCLDPDCDCKVRLLAQVLPAVQIVPVAVEVRHG